MSHSENDKKLNTCDGSLPAFSSLEQQSKSAKESLEGLSTAFKNFEKLVKKSDVFQFLQKKITNLNDRFNLLSGQVHESIIASNSIERQPAPFSEKTMLEYKKLAEVPSESAAINNHKGSFGIDNLGLSNRMTSLITLALSTLASITNAGMETEVIDEYVRNRLNIQDKKDLRLKKLNFQAQQLPKLSPYLDSLKIKEAQYLLADIGMAAEQIENMLPIAVRFSTAQGLDLIESTIYLLSIQDTTNLPTKELKHVSDMMTVLRNSYHADLMKLISSLKNNAQLRSEHGQKLETLTAIAYQFQQENVDGNASSLYKQISQPKVLALLNLNKTDGKNHDFIDILEKIDFYTHNLPQKQKEEFYQTLFTPEQRPIFDILMKGIKSGALKELRDREYTNATNQLVNNILDNASSTARSIKISRDNLSSSFYSDFLQDATHSFLNFLNNKIEKFELYVTEPNLFPKKEPQIYRRPTGQAELWAEDYKILYVAPEYYEKELKRLKNNLPFELLQNKLKQTSELYTPQNITILQPEEKEKPAIPITNVTHQNIHIDMHAPPGADEKQVIALVKKELEERAKHNQLRFENSFEDIYA